MAFKDKEKQKANHKRYYQEHKKEITEWQKEYRKKNKITLKKYIRDYYKQNKEKIKENIKSWRKKNPKKHREHAKTDYIKHSKQYKAKSLARTIKIPNGQICVICNKNLAVEKHHPNYNKPLKVEFVCIPCHNYLHKTIMEVN